MITVSFRNALCDLERLPWVARPELCQHRHVIADGGKMRGYEPSAAQDREGGERVPQQVADREQRAFE